MARAQAAEDENRSCAGCVDLPREPGLPAGADALTARVIARSPTVWSEAVQIDAGSSDGVRVDQPVVTNGGLAGRVTSVTGGTATVTLIVDSESAVSAQVLPDGKFGVVRPKVGNPNDMRLEYLDKNTKVDKGDIVDHVRVDSKELESLFPKGIPIGRVKRVDEDELDVYERDPHRAVRRLQADGVRAGAARGSRRDGLPGHRSSRCGLLLLLAVVAAALDVLAARRARRQRRHHRRSSSRRSALYAGSVPGAIVGFCTGLLLDLALGPDARRDVARPDRRRLLHRPLHGAARPRPRADPAAGRAGRQRRLRRRCRRRALHARRRRVGVDPRAARDDRDDPAQHDPGPAGVRARPPRRAAGAALRPARAPPPPRRRRRPAGRSACAAWTSRGRTCRDVPRDRPQGADVAAARAARGDHRRRRARDLRDHLLPALVPAGAVRRQVPGRGEQQPRARDQGRGAARQDRRPQRPDPRRQPPGQGGQDRAGQAARGPARQGGPLLAAGEGARHEPARAARARSTSSSRCCRSRRRPRRPTSTWRRSPTSRSTRRSSRASPSSRSSSATTRKKQIGAHLVGYVAQVSEEALKEKLYAGVKQGDRVGIAGIESSYDRYLRGAQRREPRAGRLARATRAAS